jgi:phosphatidylethanolamine-binding protein (PEBP) family uncharacterized protein
MDWTPPNPPKDAGEHRYIFGLFKQNAEIKDKAPDRNNFNISAYTLAYKLTPLAYKGIKVKV